MRKRMCAAQKKRVRKRLRKRDGEKCFLCGLPLCADATIEHLREFSKGGSHNDNNLVLMHEHCNHSVAKLSLVKKINMILEVRKLMGF